MSWNYRVVKEHDNSYKIYEIYYKEDSDEIEFYYDGSFPMNGENFDELKNDIKYMLDACNLPILKLEDLERLCQSKYWHQVIGEE